MPRKRKGADLSRSTSKARNLRKSRSERTEEQIQQQNTDARVRMAQLHQEEPEDTRAERNEVRRLEQRQSRRFTANRRRTNDQQRQQMKKDMANYTQYRMGFSKAIIMVKGAMPSKFECQLDRKKRLSDPTMLRTAYIKRLKTNIDQETKAAPDVPPGTSALNDDSDIPEMSEEIMVQTYRDKETSTASIRSVDKQVQTNIKVSYTSKAVRTKSEMVRCRAAYMRAYREKKREEKLKNQSEEPKKNSRKMLSTHRSMDFRASAAALRLSQTSTVDVSDIALPNLVVSDEVSHLEQEVQHTENIFNENTFESYIAKVDKTNLSIDPFSSNVKQEKTFDEFENNIGVWIKTDEFENFNSTFAINNIKQELENTESLPDENTFETHISRVLNVDSSSHPVKEEINAEVWIKTEDDYPNVNQNKMVAATK